MTTAVVYCWLLKESDFVLWISGGPIDSSSPLSSSFVIVDYALSTNWVSTTAAETINNHSTDSWHSSVCLSVCLSRSPSSFFRIIGRHYLLSLLLLLWDDSLRRSAQSIKSTVIDGTYCSADTSDSLSQTHISSEDERRCGYMPLSASCFSCLPSIWSFVIVVIQTV